MRRGVGFVLAVAFMSVGACSSGPGGTRESRRLIETNVNVLGWNDARVGATLIDRDGRRTGWGVDRPINQIAGCVYEAGWEEENPNGASSGAVPGSQPTPMEHHFTLANDSATPAGLIDEAGCELRLDPVVGGKVQLTLVATGTGVTACKDTTSIWVKPGVVSRWRLSWKIAGDKCAVKISPVAATKQASQRKEAK